MSIQTLKDDAQQKRETVISDGTFEFETAEDWREFRDALEKLRRPVLFIKNTVTIRESL